MDSLLLDCKNELERIFFIKKSNELHRMGKLFTTDLNNYYYDTGTGKVLVLDDDSYKIMHTLFDTTNEFRDFEDFIKALGISDNAIQDFTNTVICEHLFCAPKIDRLYTYNHYEGLENKVNEELEQIILELTGRCNLRCGYCIYNDDCDLNRDFNQNDMSLEVAKASIDYAAQHSKEEVAVTFYGGEPLLKFDLLKWVIEYSLKTLKQKKSSFSLTTNLTLVTQEIAEYLASVPNLSIVCSFDGPEYVQNSYRKYVNGSGSFSEAYRGLKLLAKSFANSKNILSINAVFAPPYTYEKIQDINDFFAKLDFLPENTDINIGYASQGSISDREHITELYKNPKYAHNSDGVVSPLWTWQKKQVECHSSIRDIKNSIYAAPIEKSLLRMQSRYIFDKPTNNFPFNGCCVPGARRLYVSTKGDLFVCERVGTSPSIGNIFKGIDFSKIKKFYIKDYSDGSIEQCMNCWAVRLCSMCYAANYSETGFCADIKNSKCEAHRNSLLNQLSMFYSVQEINPEKLEFLKDAELY